jgi:hypothetical protein
MSKTTRSDQAPVTFWRELITRAPSAEDSASKQLARRHAHLFLKDHQPAVEGREQITLLSSVVEPTAKVRRRYAAKEDCQSPSKLNTQEQNAVSPTPHSFFACFTLFTFLLPSYLQS